MTMQPRTGTGRFQWNVGAWFGSQFGATLWLLLLGGVYCAISPFVGLFVVACALAANGVGLWLWRRRDRLSAYLAIQIFCAVAGLTAAAALVAVDLFGDVQKLDPLYEHLPPWSYAMLLMYPGLMGLFWMMEAGARRERETHPTDDLE